MEVVELHPRHPGICGGTHAERAHAAGVQVQRARGEEEEEEAVVGAAARGVGRVGDEVARVGGVVAHDVRVRRVQLGEGAVRVLAVQALLVAVDHGLPVEAPRVGEGAPVREAREVVLVQEGDEGWGVEGCEGGCGGGEGSEEEACFGEVVGERGGLFLRVRFLDWIGGCFWWSLVMVVVASRE